MHHFHSTAGIAMTTATTLALVVAAPATLQATASPAAARWSPEESSAEQPRLGRSPSACPQAAPAPRRAPVVDGFRLGWLPAGLGNSVSDFTYEWDGVSFSSRVWETGSDDAGWQVDLQVTVMRGDVLSDPAAMHAYLAHYHERDPETWAQATFDHLGDPGFRTDSAVFWLSEPGIAVWVRLDGERFSDQALVRTACAVTRTPNGSG